MIRVLTAYQRSSHKCCDMPKIAIIGAGSVVFAQKLICDILQRPTIDAPQFHLMDIDTDRLHVAGVAARKAIGALGLSATVQTTEVQQEAVRDADYVINCIQVGGSEATKLDFAIPARFGLRQTIGDTLGIGGIFRALRTYPVLMELADNIATVGAPRCQLLNYTNPMAMNMIAILRAQEIGAVGLCHSVQNSSALLATLVGVPLEEVRFRCGGINHMAFFTEFRTTEHDLYPLLFDRIERDPEGVGRRVRMEMMRRTGYFVTESSEHQSEYTPYFIHHGDDVVARHRLSIDELLRRDRAKIEQWEIQRQSFANQEHEPEIPPVSHEYGSQIIEAMESDVPTTIYGNVLNHGLIDNLSPEACVEVACHVDGNGVRPIHFGRLPIVLAGIVGSNIAVQLATIEAAESGRREAVHHAAMLDPHTSATLTLDQIWKLCDELIEAHGDLLPPLSQIRIDTGRSNTTTEETKAEVSVVPLGLPSHNGGPWKIAIRGHNLTARPLTVDLSVPDENGGKTVCLQLPVGFDNEIFVEASPTRQNGHVSVSPSYLGSDQVLLRGLDWLEDRPTITSPNGAPIQLSTNAPAIPALHGQLTVKDSFLHFRMEVSDAAPRLYRQSIEIASTVTFSFSTDGISKLEYVVAPDLTSGRTVIESPGHPLPRESVFSCESAGDGRPGYVLDAQIAFADLGITSKNVLLFNVSALLLKEETTNAIVTTTALYGWPAMELSSYAALALT